MNSLGGTTGDDLRRDV